MNKCLAVPQDNILCNIIKHYNMASAQACTRLYKQNVLEDKYFSIFIYAFIHTSSHMLKKDWYLRVRYVSVCFLEHFIKVRGWITGHVTFPSETPLGTNILKYTCFCVPLLPSACLVTPFYLMGFICLPSSTWGVVLSIERCDRITACFSLTY